MSVCTNIFDASCTLSSSGSGYTSYGYTPPQPSLFDLFFGTTPFGWAFNSIFYFLILRFIIWPLFVVPLLDYLDFKRQKLVNTVMLELTPPGGTAMSPQATEELFRNINTQYAQALYTDHLKRRKNCISCEMVITHDQGIRYMLRVPKDSLPNIKQAIAGYSPSIHFKEVEDYLIAHAATTTIAHPPAIIEYKQLRSFVYPLRKQEQLNTHEPIAYIMSTLAKPKPGELIAVQYVLSPYNSSRAQKIYNKLVNGKQPRMLEFSSRLLFNLVLLATQVLLFTLVTMFNIAIWAIGLVGGNLSLPPILGGAGSSGPDILTPAAQAVRDKMIAKLAEPLFFTDIRAYMVLDDPKEKSVRMKGLTSSMASFNEPGYQQLSSGDKLLPPIIHHLLVQFLPASLWQKHKQAQIDKFVNRLPTAITYNANVMSCSEIASLYHFPNTDLTKTHGFVKHRSPELSAPLSMIHSDAKLDVFVGVNRHGGEETPIGITLPQRQKHMYVIGKTGTGKTTLLKSSIYQDMVNGKGLAVLDPHGDMFRELLALVPENRREDVVVFDPSDRDYPLGLNILDPGITFASDDDKNEWITNTVLSVFKKLSDENQWGSRMAHILRNATMTALQTPNPSLYTLQRLLTEKKYQKEVASKLKDPVLKQFWDAEFKLLGNQQMSSETAPLTHRLGHFITTKMSRHILLQQKSTLRIADIMNEGKILLVNLSKGDLGEDQSLFFGTILTSLIWMAAYQRTRIDEKDRRDFFVYVDEFQNFATPQFAEMASEGRKFRVSLILSHQNIAQVEDKSI